MALPLPCIVLAKGFRDQDLYDEMILADRFYSAQQPTELFFVQDTADEVLDFTIALIVQWSPEPEYQQGLIEHCPYRLFKPPAVLQQILFSDDLLIPPPLLRR